MRGLAAHLWVLSNRLHFPSSMFAVTAGTGAGRAACVDAPVCGADGLELDGLCDPLLGTVHVPSFGGGIWCVADWSVHHNKATSTNGPPWELWDKAAADSIDVLGFGSAPREEIS